jgi:hypothetical protein
MLAIACPARSVTSKVIAKSMSRTAFAVLDIGARTQGRGDAE